MKCSPLQDPNALWSSESSSSVDPSFLWTVFESPLTPRTAIEIGSHFGLYDFCLFCMEWLFQSITGLWIVLNFYFLYGFFFELYGLAVNRIVLPEIVSVVFGMVLNCLELLKNVWYISKQIPYKSKTISRQDSAILYIPKLYNTKQAKVIQAIAKNNGVV